MGAAYGVEQPTVEAIADVIVARTHLERGEFERATVTSLVEFVLGDRASFAALERGDRPTQDVQEQMAELIATDPPATNAEWDLVQAVLDNLVATLSGAAS